MQRTKQSKIGRKDIVLSSRGGEVMEKFVDKFCHQVFMLALLGARDVDVAAFFGVDITTLDYWKKKREGFAQAWRMGKIEFDARVAEQLGRRALGYDYTETTISKGIKGGRPYSNTTIAHKHMAPDVTAIIFFLKNRQRELWADVHRMESYNRTDVNVNHTLNVAALKDDEKSVLKSAIIRQLTSGNGSIDTNQETSKD